MNDDSEPSFNHSLGTIISNDLNFTWSDNLAESFLIGDLKYKNEVPQMPHNWTLFFLKRPSIPPVSLVTAESLDFIMVGISIRGLSTANGKIFSVIMDVLRA